MTNWSIFKSSAVPSVSNTVDSAYRVRVECGTSIRDVVVEFGEEMPGERSSSLQARARPGHRS